MAAVASSPSGSSSAGYVWEDPGDSIMIQVGLDLVERLGAAVQQGLGAGQRGTEIGGILLGRTLPGFGRSVQIEDFELAPSEHLRGASYTLSPKDRQVLGSRLARRGSRQVVGFFRSHTRPGMYLDQDDFTVFSHYFSDPSQVFLLVRPSTEGPAMGGFFFWEDGELNRRATYRQFPFDGALLAAGDFPITGGPAVAPALRPAPVLVPKPEAQPQVPARRRKLPPLPWVVVPVIAVLFLIAGLFVSENQTPSAVATTAKSPPVAPLLPEPVPQAAVTQPAAQPEPVAQAPVVEAQPVTAQPIATPKPRAATKVVPPVAAPKPAPVSRALPHEVEPPPPLAAPVERVAPPAAVLPARVTSAPPPEVEMSYEAPHTGVFKRAFHKLERSDDVSASPIRQVAPARGADARPVDVKVFIDQSGHVTRAQLLTKGGDPTGATLSAARQWQFAPARKHDKAVASEMVLHFR